MRLGFFQGEAADKSLNRINETQISKANNLKVTIGALEFVS
jgi:hypothetical protein